MLKSSVFPKNPTANETAELVIDKMSYCLKEHNCKRLYPSVFGTKPFPKECVESNYTNGF